MSAEELGAIAFHSLPLLPNILGWSGSGTSSDGREGETSLIPPLQQVPCRPTPPITHPTPQFHRCCTAGV